MASRIETVPEDFLRHLIDTYPGFSAESYLHQFELARMAWIGLNKVNQHSQDKDAMFFHYQALDRAFGQSKFVPLNTRLGFFARSPGWLKVKGITRAYYFTDALRASIAEYLATAPWDSITHLLMADGKVLKTVPKAVAAKDKLGVTTTAWANGRSLNRVRVDLEALHRLKTELLDACAEWRLSADTAGVTSYPEMADFNRAVEMIGKVSCHAMTSAAGMHYIAHHYQEAQSGRLYPTGISLASAQTVVKDAALTGNWEYDISNCHYAIFAQMAAAFGYDCLAIADYLNDKDGTRKAVAMQAGITLRQAKTCLVAAMYGARASTWHENAIPREIGPLAAERLYLSAAFKGIQGDIASARNAILSGWAKTPKGALMNAFGKSIPGTAKPAQQMAHLLQGVEAKCLQAAINTYSDDIVLVQHDGFVSTRELDVDALGAAMTAATGYDLKLEGKCLKADAYKYFSSRMPEVHSKTV
jgi:hypothetical protein